jgi:hypothetical protein
MPLGAYADRDFTAGAEMATFLAYLEPVPGRLYPLVATLQELARRGHRIVVRSGSAE